MRHFEKGEYKVPIRFQFLMTFSRKIATKNPICDISRQFLRISLSKCEFTKYENSQLSLISRKNMQTWQHCGNFTIFSVIQILREIIFGKSKD